MPRMRVLECPDCRHTCTFLAMKQSDRNPPCPQCGGKPAQGLTAPSLNRGAAPQTSIRVPENRTAAIDLAQRIVAEDNKVTNLKDRTRPGENSAMPVPVQPGMEARWQGRSVGGMPINIGTATEIGTAARRADPKAASIKDGILGRVSHDKQAHMKPVYRTPK